MTVGNTENYRAYLIGDDGRVAGFEKMSCRDDAEAISKAGRIADGRKFEVWTGARLVKAVRDGGRQETAPLPEHNAEEKWHGNRRERDEHADRQR